MIASFLWHEEPIAASHNRKTFDCGEPALNEYLQRYARQNHESGGAKTFVAVADDAPLKVLGYYSLSPASLDYAKTPTLGSVEILDILRRKCQYFENRNANVLSCTCGAEAQKTDICRPKDDESLQNLVRRGLGRYDVPIFRLGRLAVDKTLQGQKFGSRLLFCALERCFLVAQEVGGVALLIDAKHAKAAAWYQIFGAVPLEDNPLQLVIPLSTVSSLINK
jgi:hypothetical protein